MSPRKRQVSRRSKKSSTPDTITLEREEFDDGEDEIETLHFGASGDMDTRAMVEEARKMVEADEKKSKSTRTKKRKAEDTIVPAPKKRAVAPLEVQLKREKKINRALFSLVAGFGLSTLLPYVL